MLRDIHLWQAVAADTALLDKAASVDASDVAAVAKLRRFASLQAVSVALALVEARAKAVDKFGESGRDLIADVQGIEQASSATVAAYKAGRIEQILGRGVMIADLCCGVGGDSRKMVDHGLNVVAVDHDLLRAWMTQQNTKGAAQAVCADVASLGLRGLPIHLDPARRSEVSGKRATRIEDYQPGPEVMGRLIEQASAAAIKLSPGVDVESLPWPGEIEFISDHGRLVQAVLWSGTFAQDGRRATLINSTGQHHIAGEPTYTPIDDAQRYLYTFDAAVERAGLIGQLCELVDAPAIHPKLGLLTSDEVIDSPWLTGFELIERMAWRPKRVRQWLASNDGGVVEVKTRGKACDPDSEQRSLRGQGATPYVVFVLRFDKKVEALITRRL